MPWLKEKPGCGWEVGQDCIVNRVATKGDMCVNLKVERERTGPRWECECSNEVSMAKSGVGVESTSLKSDIRDGPWRPVVRTLTFL